MQAQRAQVEAELQALEKQKIEERKRALRAPEPTATAPLLRMWREQKLQAQLQDAFENEFMVSAQLEGVVQPARVRYGAASQLCLAFSPPFLLHNASTPMVY